MDQGSSRGSDNDQSCYAAFENNGENEFGMGQMARINEDSGTGGWDTLVIETEDCILIIGLSARQHLKA